MFSKYQPITGTKMQYSMLVIYSNNTTFRDHTTRYIQFEISMHYVPLQNYNQIQYSKQHQHSPTDTVYRETFNPLNVRPLVDQSFFALPYIRPFGGQPRFLTFFEHFDTFLNSPLISRAKMVKVKLCGKYHGVQYSVTFIMLFLTLMK